MQRNVAIITNIPSPYRIKLFEYMRKENQEYNITVVYQNRGNFDRSWHIDHSMISRDIFLDAFHLTTKGQFDKRVIRFPKGLGKALQRINPDIVVIAEYNPVSLFAMLWCRLHKIAYISWTDGTIDYEKDISKLQKMLRRLMIKHASAFLASSTESKKNQMMYGAPEEKIYLSFLTVDTQKLYFEREQYHSKKLLYVGRLVEIKGVDLLLKAFAKVKTVGVTLVIVGDGAEEESLRDIVKQLGLEAKVEFVGFKEGEELYQYFQKSDIFILPSRMETFGLVVLEAMCNSMPIICSQYVGCIPDLVDEDNGMIVNPYDTDSLTEAIDLLASNEGRVRQMGQNSYGRAKQFSIEASGDEFMRAVISTIG